MSKEIVTTNLADFGSRERWMLVELLTAWQNQGLPEEFYEQDVVAMFNKNSGHVFLTNSDYQTAMLNGDDLEMWHYCSNCGHEGFKEDCQIDEETQKCNECKGSDDE